ncbi:MAG: divalent-cation tolerance protein CutA [Clostridiales bacterium]|nr:divalent-cation tolerance protein CutA [Clostridiales bacterium]
MDNNYCVIITTTNENNAKILADNLVVNKLAACVQMIKMNSVYEWEGKICHDDEVLMLIKTRSKLFDDCCKSIKSLHDYDVPEIIKLNIDDGNEEYLKWISTQTK